MKSPILINYTDTVKDAKKLMLKYNCTMLCVKNGTKICGYIKSKNIAKAPETLLISQFMNPSPASVTKKSPMNFVIKLIEDESTLFVMEKGNCLGIITKESLKGDGFIQ